MLSNVRKRLTYANVAMTLALVFAMSGGAYAAKRYLITSTKQISPSVLKKLQGKPGAAGKEGPAGKEGAPGKEGPAGKEGAPGKEGAQGIQGVEGKEGKEGSPWTAGGTLPVEQTETGTWGYSYITTTSLQFAPISFAIPLSKPLGESQVHYIKVNGEEYVSETEERKSTVCLGSVAEPKAVAGNLCVYAAKAGSSFEGLQVAPPTRIARPSFGEFTNPEAAGADRSGAVMVFEAAEGKLGMGTWAVTAK